MMKSKKTSYKFWHSPFALILIFCILMLFGYKIIDLIRKEVETTSKKNLVLDQINNLQKRESALSLDIAKLNTEEGKEEIIREKYQVAKEGEKMVIIVEENNKSDFLLKEEKVDHGFIEWLKNIFKK